MKLTRIILPKQEREVLKICDDLNTYWRTNDNFQVGLIRYFEDVNFKYDLRLSSDDIHYITTKIITILFHDYDLSYANTVYIFGQFFIYKVFRGLSPRSVKVNADELKKFAYNIKGFLDNSETNMGGFRYILKKLP